ncbi:DoxX family protein [Luteolibacter yonseiensis]|uniref:DoxX family protein n=1 Tax=Luteolibacter yonseiensis TaxID=1144680 RepID=A0A934R5B1_9BACT|nr:DoxX family protein [Luteolibacter yonseiensis]MBK1817242.1 DoxX family protein [Luteolibacter yonseiensis]
MQIPSRILPPALWFARIALSAGFLSAVADRFGLWGAPGAGGVVWGNWENFAAYSASLNTFLPNFVQGPLAVTATTAEILLGIGLLIPRLTVHVALLSCLLLLAFGLAMIISLGIKAPLDYSVFSSASAALLLAMVAGNEKDTTP